MVVICSLASASFILSSCRRDSRVEIWCSGECEERKEGERNKTQVATTEDESTDLLLAVQLYFLQPLFNLQHFITPLQKNGWDSALTLQFHFTRSFHHTATSIVFFLRSPAVILSLKLHLCFARSTVSVAGTSHLLSEFLFGGLFLDQWVPLGGWGIFQKKKQKKRFLQKETKTNWEDHRTPPLLSSRSLSLFLFDLMHSSFVMFVLLRPSQFTYSFWSTTSLSWNSFRCARSLFSVSTSDITLAFFISWTKSTELGKKMVNNKKGKWVTNGERDSGVNRHEQQKGDGRDRRRENYVLWSLSFCSLIR